MQLLRSCTRALARRRYTNELHKSHQLQQRLIPSTPISLKDRQSSTVRNLSHHHYGVSPSRLDFKEHPQGWRTIQDQVEPYFAQHWKFPSEKARQAFFAVGFSQAFSQFFPLTLDERVEGTCKMHYLALLIDGELHKKSHEIRPMLTRCRSTGEDEFVRHVIIPRANHTHCAGPRLSRPRSLHRVDVVGYTPCYARHRRPSHKRSGRGFLHIVAGADGAGTSVRGAFRPLPCSPRGRCRKNVSFIPTKFN